MAKTFVFDKNSFNTNIGFGGWIKDINGVNGSPRSIAPGFPDLDDQMNQMGITHFRIHDNLGFGDLDNHFDKNDSDSQFLPNLPVGDEAAALSLIADLGNTRTIFPNAALGMRQHSIEIALSEANYTMTDKHFKKIMDNEPYLNPTNIQREIMFRIGRTNRGGRELPEDFDIYAALAKELSKRYSANYRDIGLPRPVKYWEVWNEPDLTIFWNSNDPQQYYEFYAKVAKAIKEGDPNAKVGGTSIAAGYNPGSEYLDGFLSYCRTYDIPIDFLSWHYYANDTSDPQNILDIGSQVKSILLRYGYSHLESYCTEWNSTPFAYKSVFSKVQSARNAAYIASSFIYMNHTKVDKAYYYRGDASSFGLFNDEPGFCTYAAQAFHLYNKLFDTPKLLQGGDDFTSGLSLIAGINNQGNKINILAANYEVDIKLSDSSLPVDSKIYKQHYVDGNRQIDQLTDSWSLEEWFGGVDPTNIKNNNYVETKPLVAQLPNRGRLQEKIRNYIPSRQGAQISITNVDYRSYRINAWRIKEGGPLWSMTPEDVSLNINSSLSNNTLTFIDSGAIKSTVTLYTIEFNDNFPLPDSNNPLQPISDPAQHPIGGGKVIAVAGRMPIIDFLPPTALQQNYTYYLHFVLPHGAYLMECPDNLIFDGKRQYCTYQDQGNNENYTYNLDTGEFIPRVDNLNRYTGQGRFYIYIPAEAAGQIINYTFS